MKAAKARLKELLDKTKSKGLQRITKHGRTTAVVVAAEDWKRKAEQEGNLAEFLASSPLWGSGRKLKRLGDCAPPPYQRYLRVRRMKFKHDPGFWPRASPGD